MFKSYSPVPVAWAEAQATIATMEHWLFDVNKALFFHCMIYDISIVLFYNK